MITPTSSARRTPRRSSNHRSRDPPHRNRASRRSPWACAASPHPCVRMIQSVTNDSKKVKNIIGHKSIHPSTYRFIYLSIYLPTKYLSIYIPGIISTYKPMTVYQSTFLLDKPSTPSTFHRGLVRHAADHGVGYGMVWFGIPGVYTIDSIVSLSHALSHDNRVASQTSRPNTPSATHIRIDLVQGSPLVLSLRLVLVLRTSPGPTYREYVLYIIYIHITLLVYYLHATYIIYEVLHIE